MSTTWTAKTEANFYKRSFTRPQLTALFLRGLPESLHAWTQRFRTHKPLFIFALSINVELELIITGGRSHQEGDFLNVILVSCYGHTN